MANLRFYYVYLTFSICVWSHAAQSVVGESNVYTLLFGNESTIADLHKEIKTVRERLKEHHQSLNKLQRNYASLHKRFANLENTQKLQINDNILLKLQNFMQLKLNEQSKELAQQQNNYKKTLQDILAAQKKSFKDELLKYETKLLNKMQAELVKQTGKQAAQTPFEYLQNLLNNREEIERLPRNATVILNEIINAIENNSLVDDPEDWPSYTTFLRNDYDKAVVVNARVAAGVQTANSCDEALKDANATDGGIYALSMTKYNLTDMYGYCLPDPNGDGAWLVIQRRIDNELSFNRNWQDYKNGFGQLTRSFFIGLERLHKLLLDSHGHLWIQLGTEDDESPHRIYTDFSIGNEQDKYRIASVYDYIEGFKDDFINSKGWSFQTKDVASQGTNCSAVMQVGWWYDEKRKQGVCSNGNLHTNLENVTWNNWDKVVYTHMAIRFPDHAIKPLFRWKD